MKNTQKTFAVKFVEFIPDQLEESILYVSMEYSTTSHLCACGCSREVVTPLSPVGWNLLYDGESISLTPSIGNWNFPCRSHYFIRKSRIVWAGEISESKIKLGREFVNKKTIDHYKNLDNRASSKQFTEISQEMYGMKQNGLLASFIRWIKKFFNI